MKTLSEHKDTVMSVSFNETGKKLVSGACDNTILIWDLARETVVSKMTGHTGTVFR